MVQSGSSDLNQLSIDSCDRSVSNMSKKKSSKENIVPTYADGSINYDGTIKQFYFI